MCRHRPRSWSAARPILPVLVQLPGGCLATHSWYSRCRSSVTCRMLRSPDDAGSCSSLLPTLQSGAAKTFGKQCALPLPCAWRKATTLACIASKAPRPLCSAVAPKAGNRGEPMQCLPLAPPGGCTHSAVWVASTTRTTAAAARAPVMRGLGACAQPLPLQGQKGGSYARCYGTVAAMLAARRQKLLEKTWRLDAHLGQGRVLAAAGLECFTSPPSHARPIVAAAAAAGDHALAALCCTALSNKSASLRLAAELHCFGAKASLQGHTDTRPSAAAASGGSASLLPSTARRSYGCSLTIGCNGC